jgi:rod shape-determining protein MreC
MRWRIERAGRRRLTAVLAAVACFVLILFARAPLTRAFAFLQAPLAQAGGWMRARTTGLFEPEAVSASRVQELERQRDALAVDGARLRELEDENARLRGLIAFRDGQPRSSVAARIIGRTSGSRVDRFVIDRGSLDGLEPGLAVTVGNGLLGGKVESVGPTTATVSSVNDPAFTTAVALLDETRTVGVASGGLGRLLSVRFIPSDLALSVNDLVVTSGLEDGVPGGLVLGVVTAVRREENAPFQEVVVEPLADMRDYHEVLVVLKARPL